MRFAPHTEDDRRAMLERLGLRTLEDVFAQVPEALRAQQDLGMHAGHAEPEARERLRWLASRNRTLDDATCFLGGGVYDHYVPELVRWVTSRSELATAYTPYQAELSQGLLEGLFEFQTMVSEVTGLPVANASLHDGATALVEAVHLSATATGRSTVVVAASVDPRLREVLRTHAEGLGLQVVAAPLGPHGSVDPQQVGHLAQRAAAIVVQHPNAFGVLEAVPALAEVAHEEGARLVVHFDVLLAGVLEPPGHVGADVVVADGISVGNQPSLGGPGVGMMAVGEQDLRLLPGRVVGRTTDVAGRTAYVLTLQAREQHIRRERATSNICTNQALNAIATSAYLAWLGPDGLREMGLRCLAGAGRARAALAEVAPLAFPDAPTGKEFALRVPDPHLLAARLADQGFLVGPVVAVGEEELLLVAVTEQRTVDEVVALAAAVGEALGDHGRRTRERGHRRHRQDRGDADPDTLETSL